MDANGEPKDLRNTPRYEAVSQVKMPEQRQMPESEAPAPSQTRFMPEGVDEDGFYSQLDKVITDPQELRKELEEALQVSVNRALITSSNLRRQRMVVDVRVRGKSETDFADDVTAPTAQAK